MKITVSEMAEKLLEACKQEHAQFTVCYHQNPDGDCICSAIALAMILRSFGAKCNVPGDLPEQFEEAYRPFHPDSVRNPIYIAVDCKEQSRLAEGEHQFTFWIDHHGSPEEQAAFELVDETRSSCGELILELAEAMGAEITKELAILLYVALLTDTNCFRSLSVNAQSFEAARKLALAGAELYGIALAHSLVKSAERTKLEARAFDCIRHTKYNSVTVMTVTLADLEACGIEGQDAPETENLNSLPTAVKGTAIGVMLREYPGGKTRFSVHSTEGWISARAIAEELGGGGHEHAAGGTLDMTPDQAFDALKPVCDRHYEQYLDDLVMVRY